MLYSAGCFSCIISLLYSQELCKEDFPIFTYENRLRAGDMAKTYQTSTLLLTFLSYWIPGTPVLENWYSFFIDLCSSSLRTWNTVATLD